MLFVFPQAVSDIAAAKTTAANLKAFINLNSFSLIFLSLSLL
jgi:hypothetical protein